MPYSKNGHVLQVGSKVTVECTVTSVHAGEEYCNVTVETDEVMFPGESKTSLTLNAKQVNWTSDPAVSDPPPDKPPH